mmetsp:Transcript_39895/g.65388  ORF Transcript_39895/g.65388 Transcript_39895/m.65388 type:complete len:403 (-) Transcript_39895:301-1509(-)
MAAHYAGLSDDHDSADDIQLDVAAEENEIGSNIKISTRFTKNASKTQESAKDRGVIKISLEETPSPSPPKSTEFQGFNVDEETPNTVQNVPMSTSTTPFTLATTNVSDGDNVEMHATKKKKKKKKKSQKYKNKKDNDGIDMMPLSSATDVTETELIDHSEPVNKRTKSKKSSPMGQAEQQQQQQHLQQASLSRHARIKQYIKDDVSCWLFTGLMLSLLMFAFSAITIGIAEDLVIYHRDYEQTICTDGHAAAADNGAAQTTAQPQRVVIGDVLRHETIDNYFTCCVGAVVLSFLSLLIALVLICCKNWAKKSRDSLLVSASYIVIGIVGGCIMCVWDVLLSMTVIHQLRDVVTQCDQQQQPQSNAQQLLTEFDVLGALVVPFIFVVLCTVYFVRIKLCSYSS